MVFVTEATRNGTVNRTVVEISEGQEVTKIYENGVLVSKTSKNIDIALPVTESDLPNSQPISTDNSNLIEQEIRMIEMKVTAPTSFYLVTNEGTRNQRIIEISQLSKKSNRTPSYSIL